MIATLCTIRRSTIIQVTRPPLSLWRYHWHELFPIARGTNGNGGQALYLPEIERWEGRRALSSRLREALVDLRPENDSPIVVEGYMLQILEDRAGLLPGPVEADLDALIASLSSNGNSTNGSSTNGSSPNVPPARNGQRP